MTQPARLAETTALLKELRADGYGDDEHAAALASVQESPNSLPLRRAISQANWENPNGEAIELGAHDRYLHTIPRAQARAIVAIQDMVAKQPLGRGLVDTARAGGVEYGFSNRIAPQFIAQFNVTERRHLFNSQQSFPDSPGFFVATAAYITSHELAHSQQYAVLGQHLRDREMGIDDLTIPLDDRILTTRHLEATANSVAVQVAFDNMKAGDNRMWRSLAVSLFDQEEVMAFNLAVQGDHATGGDGRARRAAHDAFFKRADYMGKYDDQLIMMYANTLRMLAKRQEAGFPDPNDRKVAQTIGSRPHQDDDIALVAEMPDGINHLKLPGGAGVSDAKYTAPSSDRRAGQVLYLMGLAERFRTDQTVTMQMVDVTRTIQTKDEAAKMLDDLKAGDELISAAKLDGWQAKRRDYGGKPTLILPPGMKPNG
ncbi:MAG: DUF6782 family putative metallopeptidase [Pseudomonadota bacterium]